MGDFRVIPIGHALCGSQGFQHNFQFCGAHRCALCPKFQVSLRNSDRQSLLVAVILRNHWSAQNARQNFGDPKVKIPENYAQVIVKASCQDLRVLPQFTENLVMVLSDTQSLTHSWSWALLEKRPTVQRLKNFLAFYGTSRFITVFKSPPLIPILSQINPI
jgi:hypothetical protein